MRRNAFLVICMEHYSLDFQIQSEFIRQVEPVKCISAIDICLIWKGKFIVATIIEAQPSVQI